MKKALASILTAAMLLSAACVPAFAASYRPTLAKPISVSVKKADPANVKKDGKIGENEYERVIFPSDYTDDENPVPLTIVYGDTEMYDYAENMVKTMEYYFSWDAEHGFNFAVKYNPGIKITQNFTEGTDKEKPGDDFLNNIGLQIELDYIDPADRGEFGLLYYAISKNPDTGEYLEGHYNQLGLKKNYNPEAEKEYVINYLDDGSVIYEWSVPFDNFLNNAAAGSQFNFTVCAMAGTCTAETVYEDCFGVCLGEFGGFLIKQDENTPSTTFTLSSEEIQEDVTIENPFDDLDEEAYYYDSVLWAVGKGITDGTTPTTFEPDKTCTRGQIVTFLWRALGKPEPKATVNPFSDVAKGSYYYDAVLWAVEKSITNGMNATHFMPNKNVTRGQTVTFLWRAAGEPEVSSSTPFTDISNDAFYTEAVVWAVNKNITKGNTATTFGPEKDCTRGQIVTFLDRFDKNA